MENFSLVKAKWSQHKDKLKTPIEKIGRLSGNHSLYTDIDKACSNEWAFLFLGDDGFIILRPRHRRQTDFIEITVAYCKKGDAIKCYQPFVIELAKKGSAVFLEFLTVRKGFDRLAPNSGWKNHGKHKQYTIWRYNLRG